MSLTSSCLENGEIVINSGNSLTIETADEFIQLIHEGLRASQHVAVAFEATVAIDLTGMQLFCSACKTAAAQGKTISFQGSRPQALNDIVDACGARLHACKQNLELNCIWFRGEQ